MDLAVSLGGELEAAMSRRGVGNNTFGIDGGALRRTPGSVAVDPRRSTCKPSQFAAMLRLSEYPRTERSLILDSAVMRIEVVTCKIREWTRNAPGGAHKILTVSRWHHGEDKVSYTRHGQAVCTFSKFHP
jgi:hypothetical protein